MAEDISGLAPTLTLAGPLAALRQILAKANGSEVETDVPVADTGDEWAVVLAGFEALASELSTRRAAAAETERRLHANMEMMIAMAGLDFSHSVPVGDDESIIDAVATATNLLNEELRASTVSKAYVDKILESIIDPLLVVEPDATIRIANPAALKLSGYAADELIDRSLSALFADELSNRRALERVARDGRLSGVESMFVTKAGQEVAVELSASAIGGAANAAEGIVCVLQDITARKQAEEALRRSIAQEETIRAQTVLLAELSTPVIPISDRVLVLPLIGSIDSRRAQQVIETLLQGITSTGADTAIIDITGVPMVDTQVANALIRAAQALKLLGARAMLTGIRPEVAQTLVGLGIDLSAISTHSSLQSGIAAVLGRR